MLIEQSLPGYCIFKLITCSQLLYTFLKIIKELSVKHALILKNILIMRSLIKELMKSAVTVSLNAVALGLGCVTHTG